MAFNLNVYSSFIDTASDAGIKLMNNAFLLITPRMIIVYSFSDGTDCVESIWHRRPQKKPPDKSKVPNANLPAFNLIVVWVIRLRFGSGRLGAGARNLRPTSRLDQAITILQSCNFTFCKHVPNSNLPAFNLIVVWVICLRFGSGRLGA